MTEEYRSHWPDASAADPLPSFSQPPAGPGHSSQPGYRASPARSDYAGWGQRVRARLIDQGPTYLGLIIFYAGYLVFVVELAQSSGSAPDFDSAAIAMIIGLSVILASMIWVAYNRWMIAGRTGQIIRQASDQDQAARRGERRADRPGERLHSRSCPPARRSDDCGLSLAAVGRPEADLRRQDHEDHRGQRCGELSRLLISPGVAGRMPGA